MGDSEEVVQAGTLENAESLVSLEDLETKRVYVPQWRAWVILRMLSGDDRDWFEKSSRVKVGKDYDVNFLGMKARLLVRSLVNSAGERLFGDGEAGSLAKKNGAAIQMLFDEAQRLNGYTDASKEDAVKNSDPGQNDLQNSGSVES